MRRALSARREGQTQRGRAGAIGEGGFDDAIAGELRGATGEGRRGVEGEAAVFDVDGEGR